MGVKWEMQSARWWEDDVVEVLESGKGDSECGVGSIGAESLDEAPRVVRGFAEEAGECFLVQGAQGRMNDFVLQNADVKVGVLVQQQGGGNAKGNSGIRGVGFRANLEGLRRSRHKGSVCAGCTSDGDGNFFGERLGYRSSQINIGAWVWVGEKRT
jgi:hypothetical protein